MAPSTLKSGRSSVLGSGGGGETPAARLAASSVVKGVRAETAAAAACFGSRVGALVTSIESAMEPGAE